MKAPTGKQLRDTGMQLAFNAVDSITRRDMETTFKTFCQERKELGAPSFRFEEYVEQAKKRGWKLPSSSKAVGPFAKKMMEEGLIEFTGQYQSAQSPKTRSHPVKVWKAI